MTVLENIVTELNKKEWNAYSIKGDILRKYPIGCYSDAIKAGPVTALEEGKFYVLFPRVDSDKDPVTVLQRYESGKDPYIIGKDLQAEFFAILAGNAQDSYVHWANIFYFHVTRKSILIPCETYMWTHTEFLDTITKDLETAYKDK